MMKLTRVLSSVLCGLLLLLPTVAWAVYGEIQPDGTLEGLWHLNGDTDDAMGNHNCTISGTVTSTNAGVFGGAYTFDGSTDYLSCGTATLNMTDKLTIMGWVYSTDDISDRYIIGKHNNSPNKGFRLKRVKQRDSFGFEFSHDGSDVYFVESTNGSFPVSTWLQVALTYDGSNIRLYINAEEDIDNTFPYSTSGNINESNGALCIGNGRTIDSTSWMGDLEELSLRTDKALSATEIKQIYAVQKGHYGTIGYLDQMPPADRFDAAPRTLLSWDFETPWGLKVA